MVVFILGINSDIGTALAQRYRAQGYTVIGTYRNKNHLNTLLTQPGIRLLHCDIAKKSSVRKCLDKFRKLAQKWDIFISCAGTLEPIGSFFDCDFNRWEESITVNAISQLRFLHGMHPFRRKGRLCQVVFLAGGGTNSPLTNYSAYCTAKIMLIKMCELLDDENRDLNVFIIGPGWVRTKIHNQTLKSRLRSGKNYDRALKFLRSDNPGTPYQDIYDCIHWCIRQGRQAAGGRNFSVVHDRWRNKGLSLARQLRADTNKFKLRRFKNK
jgi:NAD(P)-dependent dehydrogenase (short-subunit alcohol dehydrogenase family)